MSKEIMQQALSLLYDSVSDNKGWCMRRERVVASLEAELAKTEPPDLRAAAEMALEALKWSWSDDIKRADKEVKAIAALRQALAQPEHPLAKKADNARELGLDYEPEQEFSTKDCPQPELCHGKKCEYCRDMEKAEQEPVAWLHLVDGMQVLYAGVKTPDTHNEGTLIPLYTAPPRKEWVGLTDDEIANLWNSNKWDISGFVVPFTRAIEAKLKEKNSD